MSKLAAWYPLHKDTNDWSGNEMHFSKVGNGLVVDDGVTGKCLKIAAKGKGDRLVSKPFKVGGDHAMFCFLNVTEIAGTSANGVLGVHDHVRNTGTGITLKAHSTTDLRVSVNTGNGSSRTYNTYGGATNLTLNKWNHVGFTWEQSARRLRLYVNGKLDYESVGVIPEMAFDANSPLAIFAWSVTYGSGQYAPAQKIQDVRIYSEIPSLKEIDTISKGCFLHWNFNQQAYGALEDLNAWDGHAPYLTVNESRASYVKLTMKTASYVAIKPVGKNYVGKVTRISGNLFKNGKPVHVTQVSTYEPTSLTMNDKETGWFCSVVDNRTNSYLVHGRGGVGTPAVGDVYEFKNLRVELLSESNGVAGSVRDSTGFKNDGEATNDLPMYAKAESNIGAGCYYFDDNSIYSKEPITIGGSNMLTMATWIKTGVAGYTSYHLPLCIGTTKAELSIPSSGKLKAGFNIGGVRKSGEFGSGLLDNKWHHIATTYDGKAIKAYIDGKLVGSLSAVGQLDTITSHVSVGQLSKPKGQYSSKQLYQSSVMVFGTALSAEDIEKLARQRLTVDKNSIVHAYELVESLGNTRVSSKGQLVSPKLLENNFKPNSLNYSSWVIGQTNALYFDRNGATTENEILVDKNPHGFNDVMWRAKQVNTSPDADGGFNTHNFDIDNKKAYRFTCWFNRKVMGAGSFYLGTHGYAANGSTALETMTGSSNNNPYFHSGNPHKANEWFLVVGYVYPAGATVQTYSDDGIYLASGKKILAQTAPFRWAANAVKSNSRAYLYYSNDLSTEQNFYRPRVDAMDGTEPSLTDLLKCQEHTPLIHFYDANGRYKDKKFGLSKTVTANEFKEI